MPGTAVMSKLASSSTRMMCGGLPAGWHGSSPASANRSGVASSSIQPLVISSATASTPEREKFDT